jgi:prevent-host-death family protein
MKTASLAEVKDQFSKYLDAAAHEDIVITRHGKPSGVLIGFATEDDWFEYKLLNDPRFMARIQKARDSFRAGRGIPWEDAQRKDEAANNASYRTARPRRARRR